MSDARKPYPSDVSDAEWEFLAPYLALMREDAPQREYRLRDVFDPQHACNPMKVLPGGSRCGDLQSVPAGAWI